MNRVLVTGAGGFVGSTLGPMLAQAGYPVRAAVRTAGIPPPGAAESVVVGDIGGGTDWTQALHGVGMVIHLAGRAHVLGDEAQETDAYLETNARGTQRLAAVAPPNGIRRLVYLSSVKVNGEGSANRAYTPHDVLHPADAYGWSKWQADQFLAQTAAATGIQAVVVRSPLVYGPGVRANFLRLMHWVDSEHLLPLGAIRNRRSLVSVRSLCDLLMRVLEQPDAAGRAWMVSDDHDVSTPDLIRHIAAALGQRARLLAVPAQLLRLAGALVGRGAEMRRLCGSLTVDIGATRALLGWSPPLSLEEGLARTASWYRTAGRVSG